MTLEAAPKWPPVTLAAPPVTNIELDRLLAARGGLLTTLDGSREYHGIFGLVERRFQELTWYAERTLYNVRPRRLFVGLTAANEFGAFAYASAASDPVPFDFIGVSAGTILTLLFSFQRVLAHPSTFRYVGAASEESSELTNLSKISTNVVAHGQGYVTARDQLRRRFAILMTCMAADYIVYHELTHLKNGHLEYLRNRGGRIACWDEAMRSGYSGIEPGVLQALELDADDGATGLCVLRMLGDQKIAHEQIRMWQSLSQTPTADPIMSFPPSNLIAHNFFASYFVWRLFGRAWDRRVLFSNTHPPVAVRMLNLVPSFELHLRATPELAAEVEGFLANVERIVSDAERIFGAVQGIAPDLSIVESVVSHRHAWQLYLNVYRENWGRVRPELLQWCRSSVLPE